MSTKYLRIESSQDPLQLPEWAARIGTEGWVILQSYPALKFERWRPGDALPELGEEFAGRIFGELAEVRWTREGSRFELLLLEDVAEGAGDRFNVTSRFYYGFGYRENGRFWESNLPFEVEYPIKEARDGDRPRFRVFEYNRVAQTEWSEDADEIEEAVNQPALVAYRLAGFDAGRDGE